MLVSVFMLVSV